MFGGACMSEKLDFYEVNVVYENEKRESQMQEKNHAISFQFGIRE